MTDPQSTQVRGPHTELVSRLRSHAADQRSVAEGIRNGDELVIRDRLGTADNWAKAADDFEQAADALSQSNPQGQQEVVEAEVDSGMKGNAVVRAEWLWANLPINRRWTSLTTYEKALICHVLASFVAQSTLPNPQALREVRELIECAPEPYEWMSKADFKAMPAKMRGFVDAHRTWLTKARQAIQPEDQTR